MGWIHEQEYSVIISATQALCDTIAERTIELVSLEAEGITIPVDFFGMLEQLARDEKSVLDALQAGRTFTQKAPLVLGGPFALPKKPESWWTKIKRKWEGIF